MGMTMTQKILAAHAGLERVEAGQLIEADLDLVLGNDITSPVAIKEMEKMKVDGVFDKDKIALVPDHIIGMIGVDGALYKSMEFVGDGIASLTMDDRFTIANMAIEAGGKNGIFPVDDQALLYMKEHSMKTPVVYEADEDAVYDEEYTIDLGALRPTIAFPHLPENSIPLDEISEDV